VAGARPRKVARRAGVKWGLSARRAAVLAIVVCALALTLAVPLRTYLSQRQQLADTVAQREQLRGEVAQLEQHRAELNDPAYVQAQARQRLRYVKPGQTPYQVQLPGAGQSNGPAQQPGVPSDQAWYSALWASVNQPAAHP
jgi:cell division protein FtsB